MIEIRKNVTSTLKIDRGRSRNRRRVCDRSSRVRDRSRRVRDRSRRVRDRSSDNFSSVYWIFTKLGHMNPCGRGRTLFILESLLLYCLIIYIDGHIL
jgi:hypothetical protein